MSNNLGFARGGTLCFRSGAWAPGTDTTKLQTTVVIPYVINGIFYSKAITDDMAYSFSGTDVYSGNSNGSFTGGANGSTRVYLICLDSAGALSVVPGPIVDTADLAAGDVVLRYPERPNGVACSLALRIAVTSGTSFVPGTTALDAAGVTDTYENVADVPSTPLTS